MKEEQKPKKKVNLALVLGVLGALAGIYLIFYGNRVSGIFGTISSAGLAYVGWMEMNGKGPFAKKK